MSDPTSPLDAKVTDEQIIYTALLDTLRYVQAETPSNYALARHIVTTSLLLPQECKGGYLKGVAGFFRDDSGEDFKDWMPFRNKLMAQTLKAQTLVQAVATLLEDWPITDASTKQLELFATAGQRVTVNMTTGEIG